MGKLAATGDHRGISLVQDLVMLVCVALTVFSFWNAGLFILRRRSAFPHNSSAIKKWLPFGC